MKRKSIRDMRVRTKLIMLGGVSILGLFVLGSESVSTAWQINQRSSEISDIWMTAVITAEELNTATSDYRIKESRHAMATDPQMMAEMKEELDILQSQIEARFKLYWSLPTMEQDQNIMKEAEGAWREYLENSEALLESSEANRQQKTLELMLGESQALFEDMSNLFLDAVESTKQETALAKEEANQLYQRMSHMKLLLIALDVIVVLWLIQHLIHAIEKPAEALATAARRATNGNLDSCLNYKSEDEIGALTEAMNMLLKRLRSMIQDQKMMFREIGNENFDVHSECEKSYRGDFAPILYSFTSLQTRLKEMRKRHENEVEQLENRITELEKKLEEQGEQNA